MNRDLRITDKYINRINEVLKDGSDKISITESRSVKLKDFEKPNNVSSIVQLKNLEKLSKAIFSITQLCLGEENVYLINEDKEALGKNCFFNNNINAVNKVIVDLYASICSTDNAVTSNKLSALVNAVTNDGVQISNYIVPYLAFPFFFKVAQIFSEISDSKEVIIEASPENSLCTTILENFINYTENKVELTTENCLNTFLCKIYDNRINDNDQMSYEITIMAVLYFAMMKDIENLEATSKKPITIYQLQILSFSIQNLLEKIIPPSEINKDEPFSGVEVVTSGKRELLINNFYRFICYINNSINNIDPVYLSNDKKKFSPSNEAEVFDFV